MDTFTSAKLALVVDDESEVRRVLVAMLEALGLRSVQAENGLRACEILAERNAEIAFVLLDLTMPVMNGPETLHRMQALAPGVKVILMSGFHADDAEVGDMAPPPAGHLQKPMFLDDLARVIGRVLA